MLRLAGWLAPGRRNYLPQRKRRPGHRVAADAIRRPRLIGRCRGEILRCQFAGQSAYRFVISQSRNSRRPTTPTSSGLRLRNKVALVSGAARGIGLAIAKTFVVEGATVWLIGIDQLRRSTRAAAPQ